MVVVGPCPPGVMLEPNRQPSRQVADAIDWSFWRNSRYKGGAIEFKRLSNADLATKLVLHYESTPHQSACIMPVDHMSYIP